MLRKQKAATNVQARLLCAEVYRDANPVCRCFRRPAEYTAGWTYVQTSAPMQSDKENQRSSDSQYGGRRICVARHSFSGGWTVERLANG